MDKHTLEALVNQGYSQAKIGKICGVSKRTVTHWLSKYELKTIRVCKCSICGIAERNAFEPNRYTKCRKCRNLVSNAARLKRSWRKRCREYLAAAFGRKCTICGYDKTISALDYHHINSEEKDIQLSHAMSQGHAWSKIIIEARKCTLVCCRCHREIHAGVTSLPENCARFNEEYAEHFVKVKEKEFDTCPVCGDEKYKKLQYCSPECSSLHQRKFNINKEELEVLIEQMPFETIGKMFGVSGNAIKKRCKLLGISLSNRRGYWQKIRAKNKLTET